MSVQYLLELTIVTDLFSYFCRWIRRHSDSKLWSWLTTENVNALSSLFQFSFFNFNQRLGSEVWLSHTHTHTVSVNPRVRHSGCRLSATISQPYTNMTRPGWEDYYVFGSNDISFKMDFLGTENTGGGVRHCGRILTRALHTDNVLQTRASVWWRDRRRHTPTRHCHVNLKPLFFVIKD